MNSVTPTFRSGSAAAMLCVALATAGCFQTRTSIFAGGEDAQIGNGTYDCRAAVQGQQPSIGVSLSRRIGQSGDVVYAYEYREHGDRLPPTKATARLRKLTSGVYLAQIEGLPAGGYNYSFVANPTVASFEVLAPAQPSSDRAARLSLQFKPNGVMPGSGELIGAPGLVVTFLESFKRSELQSVMTCRRQAA
jgi:hypothetical protein